MEADYRSKLKCIATDEIKNYIHYIMYMVIIITGVSTQSM